MAGRLWKSALWGACTWGFLASGMLGCGQPGNTDDDPPPSPDAAPAVCTPGCTADGSVRVCEPEEVLTPCALGCDTATDACFETLVPANGATLAHLDGVTAGLRVPASTDIADRAGIDTGTGRIVIDGVEVRGAGTGVVDGVGFYPLPDSEISVLAVDALAVEPDGFLFAVGARALVILSAGDVSIQGVIDVSALPCAGEATSRCGGPGGGNGALDETQQAGGCAPGGNGGGGAPDGAIDLDETGGGGGALAQDGAPGGLGGDGTAPGQGGNVNASDCPGSALVPLRGGSGGGAGGIDGLGGVGGGGGGAIQITSLTRIDITGQSLDTPAGIHAGGGGGGPGRNSTGGGGGGSGGAILLEAPAIAVRTAVLAANGGGGGGGGLDPEPVTAGEDGRFGLAQAQGGVGAFAGGLGGSLDGPAGIGASGGDATGGGGGGSGRIRLNVPEAALDLGNDAVLGSAYTRGNPLAE